MHHIWVVNEGQTHFVQGSGRWESPKARCGLRTRVLPGGHGGVGRTWGRVWTEHSVGREGSGRDSRKVSSRPVNFQSLGGHEVAHTPVLGRVLVLPSHTHRHVFLPISESGGIIHPVAQATNPGGTPESSAALTLVQSLHEPCGLCPKTQCRPGHLCPCPSPAPWSRPPASLAPAPCSSP